MGGSRKQTKTTRIQLPKNRTSPNNNVRLYGHNTQKAARELLAKKGIKNPSLRQIMQEVSNVEKQKRAKRTITIFRNAIKKNLRIKKGREPTKEEIDKELEKFLKTKK